MRKKDIYWKLQDAVYDMDVDNFIKMLKQGADVNDTTTVDDGILNVICLHIDEEQKVSSECAEMVKHCVYAGLEVDSEDVNFVLNCLDEDLATEVRTIIENAKDDLVNCPEKAISVNVDWEQEEKNADLLEAASRGNRYSIRRVLNESLDQQAGVQQFIERQKDTQQTLGGTYITTKKTPNPQQEAGRGAREN